MAAVVAPRQRLDLQQRQDLQHHLQHPLQVIVLAPKARISGIAQLATLMDMRSVVRLAKDLTHPTLIRQIAGTQSRSVLRHAHLRLHHRANQQMPWGIMA